MQLRTALREYQSQVDLVVTKTDAPQRGQPAADSDGLYAEIATAFEDCLGQAPKTTPGGSFSNIVTLVREALEGRRRSDVSKVVRAALKKMGQ